MKKEKKQLKSNSILLLSTDVWVETTFSVSRVNQEVKSYCAASFSLSLCFYKYRLTNHQK